MYVKDYLLALVVFGIMIMAASFIIADMSSQYNVVVDVPLQENYDTLTTMASNASALKKTIDTNNIRPADLAGAIFEGIGGFFGIIISSITMPIVLMHAAANDIGIPTSVATWIIGALLTMIIISVIFAIVSSILRRPV